MSWVEYVEDTTANIWYICGHVWTKRLFKSPKRVSTRKDNPQKLNNVVKPTIHHPVVIIMFNHVYVFFGVNISLAFQVSGGLWRLEVIETIIAANSDHPMCQESAALLTLLAELFRHLSWIHIFLR